MTDESKARLMADATAEMDRFGKRPIHVEINLPTLMGLVGALQLALRHPEFARRPSAGLVRNAVMAWRDSLPADMPATKQLIDLGFHRRFDG